MDIQLSKTAAEHVQRQLERRGDGLGVRLDVRRSGCSGWAYLLDYADTIRREDLVYEIHGVKVIVDSEKLPFLQGTEIDFAAQGLNVVWAFRNPNVKSECGCGESFSV